MRTSVEPVSVAVEMIDRPGLAEEQQPGRDVEDVGRAERDDRGEIGERLERRVGALDDPGGDPADHEREQRARRREHERVDAGGDEVAALRAPPRNCRGPTAESPDVGPAMVSAALQQQQERRHHQRREDHDQQRRQHRRLPRRPPRPARRHRPAGRRDSPDAQCRGQVRGRGH